VGEANAGPAFWSAGPTTVWTQDTTAPFGPGLPFPTLDVARSGTLLLAATGGPDDGDVPSGLTPAGGGTPGLWRSADSGGTWQRLDTPGLPWLGAEPPRINRVVWFGPTPVVAGAVDGRLAVWTGTFNS
jgi:hypothetical protein